MNKKTNLGKRELEDIMNNLSDLSDLDSDDDAYYQTAPVTSPADYQNESQDVIVERRLEELFGVSDNLKETIESHEIYSVEALTDILEINSPRPIGSVGETTGQYDVLPTEENIATYEESFVMDCNQRETEIEQCLDDIREEHSHYTPISTDDLSARPSSSNVIVTEPDRRSRSSRTMNTVRQPREWKIETEIHNVPEFTNSIQPQSTYSHKTRPIDVFQNFFPEYLVQVLVEQTNRYAVQNKSNNFTPVLSEEMKAYLGILIMMGLNPLPDMELYWSNDPFYNNAEILKIMPIKRYKKITENLHINDNEKEPNRNSPEYDKMYKLRPMIQELNKLFQQETGNSSKQSIDECMVKFKGRSSLKQYMPKKPIKRGFKIWARCDSVTGYLYQFEIYTGKGDSMEDEGLGYNVVKKLSAGLPENTLIAFDNFFTSCNLMEDLYENEIFAVGTVRVNRKDLPEIFKKSQPKHLRLERNQFAAVTAKPITAIKWLDTRDVNILTTAHHPTDTVFVKRTQKDGTKKKFSSPQLSLSIRSPWEASITLIISDHHIRSIENAGNFG
ncbi:unnamed protein product [Parnassius apollo]|uniref:(apollo) hypothetical protein n=1 Tax=Parnassius apollo TaxID=110799 RepID=A0A8S3WDI4_PARAO|nr:unnamed protein product [Parnassius apollo]